MFLSFKKGNDCLRYFHIPVFHGQKLKCRLLILLLHIVCWFRPFEVHSVLKWLFFSFFLTFRFYWEQWQSSFCCWCVESPCSPPPPPPMPQGAMPSLIETWKVVDVEKEKGAQTQDLLTSTPSLSLWRNVHGEVLPWAYDVKGCPWGSVALTLWCHRMYMGKCCPDPMMSQDVHGEVSPWPYDVTGCPWGSVSLTLCHRMSMGKCLPDPMMSQDVHGEVSPWPYDVIECPWGSVPCPYDIIGCLWGSVSLPLWHHRMSIGKCFPALMTS